MTKYTISFILIISSVMLYVNGELFEPTVYRNKIDESNKKLHKNTDLLANDGNEELSTSEEQQLEAQLMKAIRRGMLAELLLKQKLNDDVDFEQEEEQELRQKEKRFPKWRSGETRSRVKMLHQNEYQNANLNQQNGDYSPMLRKIWENNMLEKNRMYQNLLG